MATNTKRDFKRELELIAKADGQLEELKMTLEELIEKHGYETLRENQMDVSRTLGLVLEGLAYSVESHPDYEDEDEEEGEG